VRYNVDVMDEKVWRQKVLGWTTGRPQRR